MIESAAAVSTDVLHVTLLDDSGIFAEAIGLQLRGQPDIAVTRVLTVTDVVRRLRARHTHAAVVAAPLAADVLMQAGGGRRWTGPPPVVVLADTDDEDQVTSLVRAGAAGWVRRCDPSSVLVDTVRAVRAGETVIPGGLLTRLVDDLVASPARVGERGELIAKLTAREAEILALMERGLSRREIAETLTLSPNTVRTHLQSVLRRLRVHSTLAAVAALRAANGRAGSPGSAA